MKKTFYLLGLSVLVISLLASCTHRLTDFTVISTKNVPIGEGVKTGMKKGDKRVTGKDVAHMVLYIPIGMPNMKDAIDRAIESAPGAIGLVDGVVKQSSWWALLYGQNKYIVEGTPLYPDNIADDNSRNSIQVKDNLQPAESRQTIIHIVKQGDTLAKIAEMYGVTIPQLVEWNSITKNIDKDDVIKIYY